MYPPFGPVQAWSAEQPALVGVVVMTGGAVGDGHLLGDALALGMTGCMALVMILVSRHPHIPMMGAAGLSSFLTALAVWPLASLWSVTAAEIGGLGLFGVQLGVGMLLLTLGTRLVPAIESALIGTLDAPLAPILVWLAFAEASFWPTAIGGAVVMAGVMANVLAGGRRVHAVAGVEAEA